MMPINFEKVQQEVKHKLQQLWQQQRQQQEREQEEEFSVRELIDLLLRTFT